MTDNPINTSSIIVITKILILKEKTLIDRFILLLLLLFLFSGAFLIPYFIAMVTCGIPLFLLEVSVGQYLGVGGMSVVGQLCPILKGVGYSAIVMVFLENVYYIIIVAWTMFYIFNTFYSLGSGLPWSSCEKGSKYYKKKKILFTIIKVSYSIIFIP